MKFWRPDFCADGQCVVSGLEWTRLRLLKVCPLHFRVMREHGMLDDVEAVDALDLLMQSCRVKEAARWALKLHLQLPKKHPGLPWKMDVNGNFSILAPISSSELGAARAVVAQAVLKVRRPKGTRLIGVESSFVQFGPTTVHRAVALALGTAA